MKKLVYLFIAIGLVFTSCTDPMEDIYAEIDAQEEVFKGSVDITLTDADYAALDLNFGNFSSIDDAKSMIPALLDEKYPVWGDGALANVTFNLYAPLRVQDYTVATADYDALIAAGDIDIAALSSGGDFNDFLNYKYSGAAEGSYVELTYDTLADKVFYTLNDADYALVGNGNYKNFDIRDGRDEEDIAVRAEKIETILLENNSDIAVGQQFVVTYAIYDGSAGTLTMLLEFDGTNYNMLDVTDYTLTDGDFETIGTEFATIYPDPASSAGNYGNFDRRADRDAYWSPAMIIEAMNAVLPATTEGQRYSVTYAIYDGSSGTETISLEYIGGVYTEPAQLLISNTGIFALTAKNWAAPFTLAGDHYTELGQDYPNFSDSDLAEYRIGILLEEEFKYAEANDMIAVSYDLYTSGSGVSAEFVNYVFDGTVFNAIQSVIEDTIQFGHDGSSWLPDNTINYTLTGADYELVGNGNYSNFDVRGGKDEESVEARLAKINTILMNNFPGMAEGQKFSVTYDVYSGANEVWNMKVILTGGTYVVQ